MLERVDVGAPGVAYVRGSLRRSMSTLAAYLSGLALEEGRSYTFAPPGTSMETLVRFNEDLLGIPIDDPVVELTLARLQPGLARCFIFEDNLRMATDPGFERFTRHYLTFGAEVYHFATPDLASRELVEHMMSEAQAYPSNAILAGGPTLPALHQAMAISDADLRTLAEATEYILAKAYDHMGYVVWSRA